jgi:hypothetical protein
LHFSTSTNKLEILLLSNGAVVVGVADLSLLFDLSGVALPAVIFPDLTGVLLKGEVLVVWLFLVDKT